MKQLIVALIATGLMGSAYGQQPISQTGQSTNPPPAATSQTTASVAGTQTASTTSTGELTTFYVVAGIAAAGAIVVATGSHKGPTTGTTGTH